MDMNVRERRDPTSDYITTELPNTAIYIHSIDIEHTQDKVPVAEGAMRSQKWLVDGLTILEPSFTVSLLLTVN